jgi:hypothetical protein
MHKASPRRKKELANQKKRQKEKVKWVSDLKV